MKIYDRVEATPARVLGVLEQLLKQGKKPASRDQIISLMQPATVSSSKKLRAAANAIEVLAHTGLIQEADDAETAKLSIEPDIIKQLNGREQQTRVLTGAILQPGIQGEPNQLADVLAFMLTFPPLGMPADKAELKQSLIANGFPLEEFGLTGDTRWNALLYWATFSGLIWQRDEAIGRGLVADPSLYLMRHIDLLLEPGEEISLKEFRQRLGAICPVLDGGDVRARVLNRMLEAGALDSWPPDHLSAALSFALRRLEESKVISLRLTPDAREFVVLSHQTSMELIKRLDPQENQ